MKFKNNKTYIIAEAGVNHNGKLSIAKKLILAAKRCGANAVKFQSFIPDNLVLKDSPKAEYQIRNTKKNDSQMNMLRNLSLKSKHYFSLKTFCKKNKIDFLTSIFDEESLDFAQKKLRCNVIKIPSGEINNYFLLDGILRKNKIILSTGMSNLKEIAMSINRICKMEVYKFKKKNINVSLHKLKKIKNRITILHCVTDYPVENCYANLSSINYLQNNLKLNIGYSDHTSGILASITAVAMGAKIIEKHLTINKNFSGPDHKASLTPNEFKLLCSKIRELELLKGNGIKKIENCEKKNLLVVRKSIIAKNDIKKNELFTRKNLTAKRPFLGKSPDRINEYLGRRSKRNYSKNELIK
tara:strand:+ start:36 stop:1100 length:1065 start_codon:yes stop_codon:yes gene_type:complete